MAGRRLPLTIVVLAVLIGALLRIDALAAGFWSDDYLHHAMLAGEYPGKRAPWDLFRFASGTAEDVRRLTAYGYYPWWSHSEFKLSMLRPLASLLHAYDYHVLGLDPLLHHLHSLFWWTVTVVAAALVLFRLFPRPVAAIAVCLFALDESHTIPLLWISNRSTLLATSFSLLGLWAHLIHRHQGAAWARPASVGFYTLAFASGEYAFASVGYLLAFELLGGPGSRRTRLRSVAPVLAVVGVYLACWAGFGYGAAHSGLYTSPTSEPLTYLGKLCVGLPVLVGDLLLTVPADAWSFGSPWEPWLRGLGPGAPDWKAFQLVLGGASMLGTWTLMRRLRRWLPESQATALRWLISGAFFGLLPVLGSFVTTRLLVPASVAVAGLAAALLHLAWVRLRGALSERRPALSLVALAALCAVGFLHGPRAAFSSLAGVRSFAFVALSRTAFPLHAQLDPERLPHQRVIMLAAADTNDAPYLPFVLRSHGRPMPAGFRLVSPAPGAHDLRVVDAHTLELTVLDPEVLRDSAVGSLTRPADASIADSQAFMVPGMWVTVLETERGQPRRMRVRFETPLSDPSLAFLQASEHGLVALTLPPPGQTLHLPAPQMPDLTRVGGP